MEPFKTALSALNRPAFASAFRETASWHEGDSTNMIATGSHKASKKYLLDPLRQSIWTTSCDPVSVHLLSCSSSPGRTVTRYRECGLKAAGRCQSVSASLSRERPGVKEEAL
jgi:hypothetical protein